MLRRIVAPLLVGVVAATGMVLAGCGQKGPLYLPAETPKKAATATPAEVLPGAQASGAETTEESEPKKQ